MIPLPQNIYIFIHNYFFDVTDFYCEEFPLKLNEKWNAIAEIFCACIQADLVFESYECHTIIIGIFVQYVKVTKNVFVRTMNFTLYFPDDSYMYQYESFFPCKKFICSCNNFNS